MTLKFFIVVFLLFSAVIFTPVAAVFKLFVKSKREKSWLYRLALSVDQFANVYYEDLLNSLLVKSSSKDRFGSEDETISSVIGKNYLSNNLTLLGMWLRHLLDKIDPNHSVDSIEK